VKILFITSQWPSDENPNLAPFVKNEVEAIRMNGVDLDVFVYEGGWSFVKYFRAIREVRRRIRSTKYDVLHARFGQCAIVACAQWQVPVVVTYGGSDVEGSPYYSGNTRYRNYILRFVSWLLALLVDEVIVVSDHLGRKLPRKKYHVIPSGVDMSLFRPMDQMEARDKLGLPMARKLALFAGDPSNKRKRYDLALEASKLAGNSLDIDLIVLNDEPRDRVPIFMSACDALLLTSTNEGSPNVVKEALACNLPIVTVDVGDVYDRIGKIDSCYVCKNDSPEIIANGLISVLERDDRPTTRNLAASIDLQEFAKQILSVYEIVQMKKNKNAISGHDSINASIKIRQMTSSDISSLIDIHQNTFSGSLGISLGKRYLRNFFLWFIHNPRAVKLVASSEGSIIGYIFGAPEGYRSQLTRDLIKTIFISLFSRPWIVLHRHFFDQFKGVFNAFFKRQGANDIPDAGQNRDNYSEYVLVGIGVGSRWRGRGSGTKLMSVFEELVWASGPDRIRLSVYRGNKSARSLYESRGWLVATSSPEVLKYSITRQNVSG